MHPIINVASKVARKAGSLILRNIEKLDSLKVETKGRNDYVTEIDKLVETEIVNQLHKAYPKDAFLGEEAGQIGDSDHVWIIDPIDGTTNFIRGIPHYAISMALQVRGVLTHGIVFDPFKDEMFHATKGGGAYVNNRRIRVSECKQFDKALVATGVPMRQPEHLPAYLNMFGGVANQCGGIRRAGSAALDLAYVAAGRYDAYFELCLKPWDLAAGALLVREAGGFIGDLNGSDDYMKTGNVIAGGKKAYPELVKLIRDHRTDALKA